MLLLLIAAGLRVGFVVARGSEASLTYPDEEGYWHAAGSLDRGDGLVDDQGFRATRMPAYPAFLSLFVDRPGGVVAARIAQAVLGAAAALAVGWLGTRRFGPTIGLVAGLAVAIDPFLVFFSNLLLTETLFTAALCITWCVAWSLAEPVGGVTPPGP